MKSDPEIAKWKTRLAEKERNVVARRSLTPFWCNGSRKKNKRPKHSNCNVKSKASSTSSDSKKKTKPISNWLSNENVTKREGIVNSF